MASKINLDDIEVSFAPANNLRIGSIVLLREAFPCKVVDLAKAKTGKHGSAKIRVVGVDVLSGRKYEEIFQSKEQICLPVTRKVDYQLAYPLDEGYMKLKAQDGSTRDDLKVYDEELSERIMEAYHEGKELLIAVLCVVNKESVHSFKELYVAISHVLSEITLFLRITQSANQSL